MWCVEPDSFRLRRAGGLLPRNSKARYTKLQFALEFWDRWIDSSNHDWHYYGDMTSESWPPLVYGIAEDLRADREIALQGWPSQPLAAQVRSARPKRGGDPTPERYLPTSEGRQSGKVPLHNKKSAQVLGPPAGDGAALGRLGEQEETCDH